MTDVELAAALTWLKAHTLGARMDQSHHHAEVLVERILELQQNVEGLTRQLAEVIAERDAAVDWIACAPDEWRNNPETCHLRRILEGEDTADRVWVEGLPPLDGEREALGDLFLKLSVAVGLNESKLLLDWSNQRTRNVVHRVRLLLADHLTEVERRERAIGEGQA